MRCLSFVISEGGKFIAPLYLPCMDDIYSLYLGIGLFDLGRLSATTG
jgi:hypothetical protein